MGLPWDLKKMTINNSYAVPPYRHHQPSLPASLALQELIVHSVFTCKQSKTNTNKKPTSPYTAPAIPCHLVTTSLAKSLSESLSCHPGRWGEEEVGTQSQHASKGLIAAKEESTWPLRGAGSPQPPRLSSRASERAESCKWRAQGDSQADTWILGDSRLPLSLPQDPKHPSP